MSDADNIVCCRDLLLNETVVNNHIFSATATKIRKYKGCHDNACENGRPSFSIVVPFAVDTLGNFCSVAVIFLKKLAKIKFAKIPGSKEFQDLTQHPHGLTLHVEIYKQRLSRRAPIIIVAH